MQLETRDGHGWCPGSGALAGALADHPADGPATADDLRFCVLGPVRVWRSGTEVALGSPQQRALLALLMARAGQPVHMSKIIDVLWWSELPPSATNVVHRHVGAIRRLLEPRLRDRAAGRWLSRSAGGYQLDVGADQVDLHRFRELVRGAREQVAAGRPALAGPYYQQALALRTGAVATGCPPRVMEHPLFVAVEREYLQALKEAVDVLLDLGVTEQVVNALQEAANRHQLDESLLARLVLALGSTGRQADALDLYQTARHRLVDEFGVEPGPELRDAHARVLRQQLRPAAERVPVRVPLVRPAQLPVDLPSFAGRRAELAVLLSADELPGAPPPAVISTITGAAGLGKTALAVHAAHRLAARFPSGQLFVNLCGSDPSGSPACALRELLESLGVPGDRIPATVDGRAALYRSLLADQRVLVVLDDARDVAQVRPLLPGSPACLTIVTSRHSLRELVVAEGARPVPLGVLSDEDSVQLLARRVGAGRLAAEAGSLDDIVRRCRGLPLALAYVAARAALCPHLTLEEIAGQLRAQPARFSARTAGALSCFDVPWPRGRAGNSDDR